MLALYYLQKGYETKYIDSTNLRDLKKSLSLDYNKKEFIFIDDCLGQSYIELTKENESDLVKFIKFVKNNPNKTLLLNSRITVYKEALKRNYDFEKINKNKEKGIQILEIKEFSNIEKALILSKYLKGGFDSHVSQFVQRTTSKLHRLFVAAWRRHGERITGVQRPLHR